MVDCWCCFPSFGVSKKFERGHDINVRDEDLRGKAREREPLLGNGPRPNSTPCSHSRYIASASGRVSRTMPSEASGLGADASRNPVSDILLCLNAGKVPSQNQVSEVLREILSSGVLDIQDSEASEQEGAPESESCRRLIDDIQELLQASLDFGVQKNGDNKLQEIYYGFTSLIAHGKPSGGKEDDTPGVDIKETGLEVKSSELEFDTSTLLSACRTLVLTFIASHSFRHALSNLVSIVIHDAPTDKNNPDPKEVIIKSIREIIDRIQKDSASRYAMRAVLILLPKYGHVLSTTPTSPRAGPEIVIEIDIPEPTSGLLKNIKEILERCAGGESLDPVLSAFIRAMRNLSSDDEKGNGDAAFCVPPIAIEEMAETNVESPEDDVAVPVPVYTATPKPVANPVQISPSPSAEPENSPTENGNGNSIGNGQKKTNSRNKKKNQKAKMKKKQKALEKKDQELKNGSSGDPAAFGEVEEKDADLSTRIQSTTSPIQRSTPATRTEVEVNPSQTTQHYSSSSTQKPQVSLNVFVGRVGRFLDSLLSESESEYEGDSSEKERQEQDDTRAQEGSERIDLEGLVDDALQLFADTTNADSPEPHTLLAEVRHFTHALENDDTLARLCKAANAFSRDLHLSWASEQSSGLSQMLLKRFLRVLPLPLPLPLNCVPSSLSNTSSLPSRSAFEAIHIPDVELRMGNCKGALTDLWVCRRCSPTMVGEGEGRSDWKWLMEGARVIEVSTERRGDGEDDDTNAHYAHDANTDSETTTLLSSIKSRSSVTYTNGSTSAGHSNPRHAHNLHPHARMAQRVRMLIRVPLTNLSNPNHSPLHLHAGMENVRYSVRDVGPCGAWVGYEDDGVLDVEFGAGDIGVDGEVDVDVDLGFEEEGEGQQDDAGKSPSHASFESRPSTMKISQHDDHESLVIPEIIVIDESADEELKEDVRTEEEASESRPPGTQRNKKGKAKGKQRLKSLKVLSTTTVPQNRFAICNEEDIRIDVTRRESTRHHWPITDMLIPPFSGSRGVLVEQMVKHAVKTWVRGTLEERAKDAVEEWLAGFVGGCEWLWGGLDEVFGEDIMR